MRRFGRSVLSVVLRSPVLVLEAVGRRSGSTRSTTLAYHRARDDTLLVVGGAGGQTRVADWVLNLRANPDAAVLIDRTKLAVRCVELAGADREIAWAELIEIWPKIDSYERRAGYALPVIRLSPRPLHSSADLPVTSVADDKLQH